jgi:ABC-type transport system substrate-binding protein
MLTGAGRERRRRARAALGGLAVVVGIVALTACTDDGDDDDAAPAATEAASGDVVDGGRIRLALDGPVVADPVEASLASASDLMVLDLLHDGLARLSPEGTPQPALASEWRSNGNRTAWRFTLDPGATFSDGAPVTTGDVIASFERVAALGERSLAALRLEHVKGFAAFVDGAAEHLEGLSAPDERTVRVALDAPMSLLPQLLASPVYGVVDAAALGEDAALDGLRLTGGWDVDDAGDDSVVLTRQEARPGHLDEVELRTYDDAVAAYDAFDEGDADWAAVPGERLQAAVEDHGDEHFAPFHAELFFGMNVRSGHLLSNRPLRQAIAAAIDRDAIVREVYAELAEPLATIVPDGVAGHEPAGCDGCGHDPARAEALLEQAFPDGTVPEVHIDFDESVPQRAMAELVAEDLEAVGIPTALRPRPLEEYKDFVVGGEQELFSFGWIGVYGSPDAYLRPQLASSANDNLTGISSREVDELLSGARGKSTPAERVQLWADAERIALEGAVVVPIAQFRTQVVVAPRVQGLAHAIDGTVDWSQVSLSED